MHLMKHRSFYIAKTPQGRENHSMVLSEWTGPIVYYQSAILVQCWSTLTTKVWDTTFLAKPIMSQWHIGSTALSIMTAANPWELSRTKAKNSAAARSSSSSWMVSGGTLWFLCISTLVDPDQIATYWVTYWKLEFLDRLIIHLPCASWFPVINIHNLPKSPRIPIKSPIESSEHSHVFPRFPRFSHKSYPWPAHLQGAPPVFSSSTRSRSWTPATAAMGCCASLGAARPRATARQLQQRCEELPEGTQRQIGALRQFEALTKAGMKAANFLEMVQWFFLGAMDKKWCWWSDGCWCWA